MPDGVSEKEGAPNPASFTCRGELGAEGVLAFTMCENHRYENEDLSPLPRPDLST